MYQCNHHDGVTFEMIWLPRRSICLTHPHEEQTLDKTKIKQIQD